MGLWRQSAKVIFLGALGVTAIACTANKRPSKVEAILANAAKDVAIPVRASSAKNPVPASAETVQEGRIVYERSCALCHGADGRSATELGRSMYPPAMDLTSPHVQHWSDGDLLWIIQNGIRLTGMPAWNESISEQDS
ncbi:MAG: c-type cytochrome [Terriglobia bacterium]